MTDPSTRRSEADPVDNTLLATPHLKLDQKTERIALLLPIYKTQLDGQILEGVARAGFTLKTEFHVTILDIKLGSSAANTFYGLAKRNQVAVMDFIKKATSSPWEIKPKDVFYDIKKQYTDENLPRRSIIQIVDCPALCSFYTNLNLIVSGDIKFETPPAHITLATQVSSRGIGIRSTEELHMLGTPFYL